MSQDSIDNWHSTRGFGRSSCYEFPDDGIVVSRLDAERSASKAMLNYLADRLAERDKRIAELEAQICRIQEQTVVSKNPEL